MGQDKQIELRSEKARNIIGQVPPLLLRQGIGLIALAWLALVGVAAFIPHRESISVEVRLTQDGGTGRLHFTAEIPEESMRQNFRFSTVVLQPQQGMLLPRFFRMEAVSDTLHVSVGKSWREARLSPEDTVVARNLKLDDDLHLPAEIWLRKTSLLAWLAGKIVR